MPSWQLLNGLKSRCAEQEIREANTPLSWLRWQILESKPTLSLTVQPGESFLPFMYYKAGITMVLIIEGNWEVKIWKAVRIRPDTHCIHLVGLPQQNIMDGWLKQWTLRNSWSSCWQIWSWWGLSYWLAVGHLSLSSHGLSLQGESCVVFSSSHENTNPMGLGSTLMTSFNLNHLPKADSPNTITVGINTSTYK